jgi:hypothetical protein
MKGETKMKRLIKFWSRYDNDSKDGQFSDCSTEYEVLPVLVEDTEGPVTLKTIAKERKLKTIGSVGGGKSKNGYRRTEITHFIKLNETKSFKRFGKTEKMQVYLGFITIPAISLETKKRPNSKVTEEQGMELRDNQSAGIYDVLDIDKVTFVIMEDWSYYHALPLNGYSLASFQKAMGATDRTFSDEVQTCSECGEADWRDNGNTYNHRNTDDGTFGINCGCFEWYSKNNIERIANNPNESTELAIAEELQDEGRLVFVERFIGGMTDGRGGYFKGESTREGNPEGVLADLLKKKPNGKYVFSHDESGQFQTYFSVWELKKVSKKKAA